LKRNPVRITDTVAGPDSLMTEQFRKLRSVLAYVSRFPSLRSILVTSCLPSEGKTTVSLNLAVSLAKGGSAPVVLVDTDLRKKSLSSLLGISGAPGLSDVLSGNADLAETLLPSDIQGLALLPAGVHNGNSAELIVPARVGELLPRFQEPHGGAYVILDSPPLLLTSEPNVLAQLVDGVVFVVLAEKTRRDMVRREIRAMPAEKMLGVVLNCAEFEASHYYNKYYGSSYYGRGDGPLSPPPQTR